MVFVENFGFIIFLTFYKDILNDHLSRVKLRFVTQLHLVSSINVHSFIYACLYFRYVLVVFTSNKLVPL
jgi:hypothetical protein